MKFRIFVLIFFVTTLANAQQQDSLNLILPTDTLLQNAILKADSIALSFQSKADSLNNFYQQQFSKIDNERSKLQSKIDSLSNLKLPTERLTNRLDSLNKSKDEQISALTKKLDELKSKTTQGLQEIQLPPQLQEPMQKLQSSVQGYSPLSLDTSIPGAPSLGLPNTGNTSLPTFSNQLALDPSLSKITGVTGEFGQYSKDAKNLMKGNLDDVKSLDKAIEEADIEGLNQFKEGTGMMGQVGQLQDSTAIQDKAKELAKEQLMNVAVDHFGEKQEVLREAMDNITKLKSKYSDVKSMAELPKKLPNPYKGKPVVERIVPALSFQIQTSQYFLLDVNPMLMYLISPRLSAGLGWNQRLPFDDLTIRKQERVYGPRAAFEVKWIKGINLRLLPELLNSSIPPLIASSMAIDPSHREWVPSVFVGIKKDFTVYKTIKGNTEALYNLYNKDNLSPYGDVLAVRFGFEFPIKKKIKKNRD